MTSELYQRYLQAKEQYPEKYARDLAALLNISEAELTHARVNHDAQHLEVSAKTLLNHLGSLGELKGITRNEYAVHEHLGHYTNQHLEGHAGLILNPRDIDLRLFLHEWQSFFALKENTRRGESNSIQIFDRHGDAVHKIYATPQTDMAAWQALIAQYRSDNNPSLNIVPQIAAFTSPPVIDAQQIELEWRAMTDIHQFFPLLKRHNISRQQAFSAVSRDLAYRVDNQALNVLIHQAQSEKNEIMVFVGNRGCIQIFTGVVERVAPHHHWINIFNPRFTLHLMEDKIAESWVTRKPTNEGFVTSLELFAQDGTQIAQLFGQRTEGVAEQQQWREQISRLPTVTSEAV